MGPKQLGFLTLILYIKIPYFSKCNFCSFSAKNHKKVLKLAIWNSFGSLDLTWTGFVPLVVTLVDNCDVFVTCLIEYRVYFYGFFVIYKSDVEWPRKDIKDTGPMGVPRSAKNDHFMAPVSQNQRQTVEKTRLLNTQSKLSIPRTGYGDFVAISNVQIPKNECFSTKISIFSEKRTGKRQHAKYVRKLWH